MMMMMMTTTMTMMMRSMMRLWWVVWTANEEGLHARHVMMPSMRRRHQCTSRNDRHPPRAPNVASTPAVGSCDFKQQVVIKLCAAVAISKHGTIDRAVVVGLYPGALDEVDKVLNQLIDLRLLTCVSATRLDARFEFFHKVRHQEHLVISNES